MCHGSHSSHNSHSSTDTHSDSLSSVSIDRASANLHTATVGGVDWSGTFSSDTPLGVKGGTGSLTQLTTIVNNMRSYPTSTEVTDDTTMQAPSSTSYSPSSSATAENLNSLLDYAGFTAENRYQPYTLTINVTSTATSTGTTNLNKLSAGPVSATKSQDLQGNISTSGTTGPTWTSACTGIKGDRNTSHTYTDSLGGVAIKAGEYYSPRLFKSLSFAKGSKITKEQASQILDALQSTTLQKWTGPASKSFSWSGYNNISHANSHSST
jgi:hypothetical protein